MMLYNGSSEKSQVQIEAKKSEYGLQRVSQKAEGPKLDITSKRNLFLFKVVAIPGDEFFSQL